MIVPNHHHASGFFRRSKDSFHAMRRERHRSLAQHVNLRAQSAQHVWLVQMIRRRDNHRIEPVVIEKLFDVGEHIGNTDSLRESTRLYSVVVANRDERRAFDFREHGEMRELRDGTRADEREPQIGHGRAIYFNDLVTRWSSGAPRCQSMRPTVVPG